ncbi:MAG: DUF4859 domain-containing protein [Prevotellaceae bacterium]|nr:DUF4859 domain-containing protein [Prevotellaceae bacterium]
MRDKRLLAATVALAITSLCLAQKSIYIPQEWRNRTDTLIWKESDPDNEYTWSLSRSYETDNIVIFWDKGYGSTKPTDASYTYSVDIEDLAKKCEEFYQLECDSLGFVDVENSNLSKYKVMVLLNHTSEWVCYGSGYDYQVSALWLSPSTCKPVGSSVAHEVGHSFHYMCYCEDSNYGTDSSVQTGFHGAVGSGSTIWETTANWQAMQSYPSEMFTMSGMADIFKTSHNYAFTHEWQRYQSYMFLYYLCDHFGDIKTVADVWNYHETTVKDFNEVLMDCKGLSVDELYALYFDYAMKAVTWDLPAWEPYRSNYVGKFRYYCVQDGVQSYQVAYASVPQSTGFNVVPLKVPDAGEEVSIEFTALKSGAALLEGDPGYYLDGDSQLSASGSTKYNATTAIRNFRLGFVALMADGSRQYFAEDSLYCHGKAESTATVSLTVPDGTSKLWFVVCPSPSSYVQHKWDEKISNDDQWPYHIKISGTDLTADATVYQSYLIGDRGVGDVKISYDYYMPAATTTDANTLTLSGDALTTFGTAFQMTKDEVASHFQAYSEDGPDVGMMMLYPTNTVGSLVERDSGIEGGYGYWYTKHGALTVADSTNTAFSVEFDPEEVCFRITQVPGMLSSGSTATARLALRYRYSETVEAVARFVITLHISSSATGYTAPTIEYDSELALPVERIRTEESDEAPYYDLSGRMTRQPTKPGIYIHGGKKALVK